MSQSGETFFTVIGCMDGRVQEVRAKFGRQKFNAEHPDTITEAGIVGLLSKNPDTNFVENLKFKILVSLDKHNSTGILIDGHQECAGNPVSDEQHKLDIKKSVQYIKKLLNRKIPVHGIFIVRDGGNWKAIEV